VVHLTCFIGEDAQGGGFLREVSSRIGCILLSDTEQHDQARTDLAGDMSADQDAGFANTLNDSSHRKNASLTMAIF
jgi:hypothetical protein